MLGDETIMPEESVLRRFNPTRPDHIAQDEGTGEYRLRSGAFYLRRDEEGYSTHRRHVLDANHLAADLVKSPPYVGLAEASVKCIHACNPQWIVQPDPWPEGYDASRPVDAAHALVIPTARPTRGNTRPLIGCFAILCME